MNQRYATYLALAFGLELIACETENVSVGSEGAALNLARCWGTDCDARVPTQKVEARSVGSCDLPAERALDLEWERDLCGSSCVPKRLVTASDGTAWVLGISQRGQQVLVLSHHAADGNLLGEAEVPTISNSDTQVEADLACGARGHCYVSWHTLYSETADSELIQSAFIQEFDELARPVAPAIPLDGVAWPTVRASAEGRVALAGSAWNGAQRGSLAMLDESELRYVQNNVATFGRLPGIGVTSLAIAADGRSAVLAQRNWQSGVVSLAVTLFDAGGRPVWDRTFALGFANAWDGSAIAADEAGNLTVAAILEPADLSKPILPEILVQRLDVSGALLWAYRLHGGTPAISLDAPTGRVFALSFGVLTPYVDPTSGPIEGVYVDPEFGTIEEITSDGTSCRRYTYDYPSEHATLAHRLALGKHDDVYLVSERGLARFVGFDRSPGGGSVGVPKLPIAGQAPEPH